MVLHKVSEGVGARKSWNAEDFGLVLGSTSKPLGVYDHSSDLIKVVF